jgi:hypothetical protein
MSDKGRLMLGIYILKRFTIPGPGADFERRAQIKK